MRDEIKLYNEISKIAYQLYEKKGKAEGRDLVDWLEAEGIVIADTKKKKNLKQNHLLHLKRKRHLQLKEAFQNP